MGTMFLSHSLRDGNNSNDLPLIKLLSHLFSSIGECMKIFAGNFSQTQSYLVWGWGRGTSFKEEISLPINEQIKT